MQTVRTIMAAALSCTAMVSLTQSVEGAGADVQHSGLAGAIQKYGPVNNTYAYVLGSNTCNIGSLSLSWINRGTPALMMNAYRLANGRLEQIGTGNAKTACCVANSSNPLCGPSCSTSGFGLRPGCMDTYGAGFNAIQGSLAPRRFMNPQTGAVDSSFANITGDPIFRRLQVRIDDMNPVNWPGALFFVEGQYICTEDAVAGNDNNNASYSRVTLDASYGMTAQGSFQIGIPAIFAWRDHGNGAGVPDPSISITPVDVPGEGRFLVAARITPNGPLWRYEYAVQNLTSARAASAFNVPIPAKAVISGRGFHDVWYHDEDAVYDGTDWATPANAAQARWECTQTYGQNVNANALRYGTIYNFWFDCDVPPVSSQVELEMFNPATGCVPQKVTVPVRAPGLFVASDVVRDGQVNTDDLLEVVLDWGACPCEYTCDSDIDDNNAVDADDLIRIILDWTQ